LGKVNTWKRRGNVPHAVTSTGLLVEAIINHGEISELYAQRAGSTEGTPNLPSPFVLRSIYSSAFSRFITGFCDTPPNAAVKRSMYDAAEELGIPELWVEVRHDITHGEMPDVRFLQSCSNKAIEWLWNYFWAHIDKKPQAPQPLAPMKDLLKELLKARKDFLRGQKDQEWSEILKQILSTDPHHKDLPQTAKSLVSNRLLLPNPKSLVVRLFQNSDMQLIIYSNGLNMKAGYAIWDEPLQELCETRPSFYRTLTMALVEDLSSFPTVDPAHDSVKEATFHWVQHLLASQEWASNNRTFVIGDLQREVMETCLLNPFLWTHRLARVVLDDGDDQFREDWFGMYNVSISGKSETEEHDQESNKENSNSGDVSMNTTEPDSGINRGGWKPWKGEWAPRPIGK
jgi:ribosomal biogenesis protein LAS1